MAANSSSQLKNRGNADVKGSETAATAAKKSLKSFSVVEIVPMLRPECATRFKNGEPIGTQTSNQQTTFKAFRKSRNILSTRTQSLDIIPDSQVPLDAGAVVVHEEDRGASPELFVAPTQDEEERPMNPISASPTPKKRAKKDAIIEEENDDVVMEEIRPSPPRRAIKSGSPEKKQIEPDSSAVASTRRTRSRKDIPTAEEPAALPPKRRRR